jgi:hypothetical protein
MCRIHFQFHKHISGSSRTPSVKVSSRGSFRGGTTPRILISALEAEWSVSRSGWFTTVPFGRSWTSSRNSFPRRKNCSPLLVHSESHSIFRSRNSIWRLWHQGLPQELLMRLLKYCSFNKCPRRKACFRSPTKYRDSSLPACLLKGGSPSLWSW